VGRERITFATKIGSNDRVGDPKNNGYMKLMSKVLLPLPTELADGLRQEGVFLNLHEIRPNNWFLRSKSNFKADLN
jgi:hypothetical protein